jgi:hypothetical protein
MHACVFMLSYTSSHIHNFIIVFLLKQRGCHIITYVVGGTTSRSVGAHRAWIPVIRLELSHVAGISFPGCLHLNKLHIISAHVWTMSVRVFFKYYDPEHYMVSAAGWHNSTDLAKFGRNILCMVHRPFNCHSRLNLKYMDDHKPISLRQYVFLPLPVIIACTK